MTNQNANDNDTNVINADNNSSNVNSNRNDEIGRASCRERV